MRSQSRLALPWLSPLVTAMLLLMTACAGQGGGTAPSGGGQTAQRPAAAPTSAPAGAPAASAPSPAAAPAAGPAAAPASTGRKISEGRIVVSQATDADTLDPILLSSTNSQIISRLIMEPLVETDTQTGKTLAKLATEWKRLDENTWEVKLRQGVKFHNGAPLTAEDVAYSFNRILTEPKNRLSAHAQVLKEATAVDPQTVRITTKVPQPTFLDTVAPQVGIVSKQVLEKVGIDNHNVEPVGTGPWKFVEWKKDDHLTITRYADYWAGPAAIKEIVFRPIPNDATRVAELETGGVDLAVHVPPEEADRLSKVKGIRIEKVPTLRTIYIGMNTGTGKAEVVDEPLKDVRVRQAIQKAIDVEAIIKDILNGDGIPIASSLTRENYGFDPDLKPIRYDPEGAKKLLAEAGYPNGITIDFNVPQGRYVLDKEVGEAVAGQLAKVGIKTNLMIEPWKGFYDKYLASQFKGIFLLGVGKDISPDRHFYTYFHSKGRGFYFRDPEVDALIDKAIVSFNEQERLDTFKQLQRMLVEKATWANLYQQVEIYGIRDRITDFKGTVDELLWLYEAGLRD